MGYSRYFVFFFIAWIHSFCCFSQEMVVDTSRDAGGNSREAVSGWSNIDSDFGDLLLCQHFNDGSATELGIKGQSVISSNAVNLSFSVAALRNKFLDEERKQEVSQHLNPVNTFEFNTSGQLFYRFVCDSFLFQSPALISISFETGSIQQAQFTDDLFNVVFFGNAGYAGQTADFSGSEDLSFNYNELRFALQKKFKRESCSWEIGTGISFITGKYGSSVKLDHATLFTEQYGEYIDADYNFRYFVSDSSNSGRLQADGVGASIDASVSFLPGNKKSRCILSVNDAGFIGWNKNSRIYSADSSLHFEGIEVTDFLHGNDSTLFQFNSDTLLHKTGTDLKQESHATALPLKFSFAYIRMLNERWIATGGISYRPFPDLMPLIFVQPQYAFTPSLRGAFSLAYGGTCGFQLGLQVNGTVKHRVFLQAGSENILGIFVPKQTTSTSLFLQASFRF